MEPAVYTARAGSHDMVYVQVYIAMAIVGVGLVKVAGNVADEAAVAMSVALDVVALAGVLVVVLAAVLVVVLAAVPFEAEPVGSVIVAVLVAIVEFVEFAVSAAVEVGADIGLLEVVQPHLEVR